MMCNRIAVIPCSGIGKSLGTVGREAAYLVTEQLGPQQAFVPALAPLVLGDPESLEELAETSVITVDGCRLACASKTLEECGVPVARSFSVMEVHRRHRGLKPQGIAELNADGRQLADTLTDEIVDQVRQLRREGWRDGRFVEGER
jgi:uncharacterized metal-binding protein